MSSTTAPALETPLQAPRHGTTLPMLMLVLCCVLWGLSFPTAQHATLAWERALGAASLSDVAARSSFCGWRYAMAALVYLAMTLPRQRGLAMRDLRSGGIVGVLTTGGILFQLLGLRYTVPSTSAFLTAMAVVFTPLAQMLLLRRPVSGRGWTSIALALAGMILLSRSAGGVGEFVQKPPFPFAGEVLTLIGSVLFTCQILAVDRWGKTVDAARLTLVSLACVAIVSLAVGIAFGASPEAQLKVIPELATDVGFLWRFASLFLLATAIGTHLMNRYQPLLSPATATVIYCLEPVFGTLFSLLMGNESLTLYTVIGGGVILGAVLLTAKE